MNNIENDLVAQRLPKDSIIVSSLVIDYLVVNLYGWIKITQILEEMQLEVFVNIGDSMEVKP